MLSITDLSFRHGERVLFDRASVAFSDGWKVGLVGRNGAGKTSLLRVLGGAVPAAKGVVLRPDRVGFLPQDPPARGAGVDGTALSHVLSGRGLDTQTHVAADEAERLVRTQDAGQQPCLREDLEPVADAEHEPAVGGERRDRAHDRREPRDRAAAQVVAV